MSDDVINIELKSKIMVHEKLLEKPIWQMTGKEFISLIQGNDNANEEPDIPANPDTTPRYVYGIRGIANLMNCSISTANRIKKKGILDEAIIQQGRTIIVDAEKALKLLKQNSEI